ncbi:MAG: hypothetical protein KAI83_00690 [Thiomargarita sp.]|nr:hypothetical protein [Thiomargarita sp.]
MGTHSGRASVPFLSARRWRVENGFPRRRVTAIKLRADTQVCPYQSPNIQGL